MKTCIDVLYMAVKTTGGYNSKNNGIVESPIKPVTGMIQALLIGSAMPDII